MQDINAALSLPHMSCTFTFFMAHALLSVCHGESALTSFLEELSLRTHRISTVSVVRY